MKKNTNQPEMLDFSKIFTYAPPSNGKFCLLKKDSLVPTSGGYQCRESFARRFTSKHIFIGFHLNKITQVKKVIATIKTLDKKLRLSKNECNSFQVGKMRTGAGLMLVVKTSAWWRANMLRRQILTAVMRASLSSQSKFEDKINQSIYFNNKNLQNAFHKFLSGYTCCTKRLNFLDGWTYTFRKNSSDKLLIKPE